MWVTKTRPLLIAEVPEAETRMPEPEVTPAPGLTSMAKPVVVPVADTVKAVPVKEAVLLVKLTKLPAVEDAFCTVSKLPTPEVV